MNLLKKHYFFYLITIGCFSSFAHQETPTVGLRFTHPHARLSNNHIKHGIRATNNIPSSYTPASCYTSYNKAYYASLLPTDFQQVFKHTSDMSDILNNYPLYAFPNFIKFAQTLPYYDTHILALHNKIQHDKTFNKQTACMPYFENSFCPGYKNSGFHNFIAAAAQRITNAEELKTSSTAANKGTLQINSSQSLDLLVTHCSQKIYDMSQNDAGKRLAERINAINQTRSSNGKCFDYSPQVTPLSFDDPDAQAFHHRYGTQLDCQLHKELCQTRNTMRQLEHTYSNDAHVQILAPVVYRYTLQAKNEQCPVAAFELSDFCYTITQVLSHGMHVLHNTTYAIGKGAWKGANDFVSIEHWKGMATGAAQIGLLFADALGQEDALHYAMVLSATSNNSDAVITAAEKYCVHTTNQKNAINLCAQETYNKIKMMSWQEILEHGAEMGTTMILDTLALNAVNGFTSAASNLVTKQLSGAIESGALFTEQYAVEIAGFGKLIIEEGAEISTKAADIIKNDFALFAKSTQPVSQQIKQKLPSFISPKNIIQKIRNIGDDILDVMEKAGGHTLEKHVGKTYDDLFLRAMEGINDTITTFSSKRTAINAVKENLKHNADEIASWLATQPPLNKNKSFDFLHSYSIGTGIIKGKKNGLSPLSKSKIILVPCSSNEFGFEIITSFPTPT